MTDLDALEGRLEKLGLELLETEDRLTAKITEGREVLGDIRVTLKTVQKEQQTLERLYVKIVDATKDVLKLETEDVIKPLYDRALSDLSRLRIQINETFQHWEVKVEEFSNLIREKTVRQEKRNAGGL